MKVARRDSEPSQVTVQFQIGAILMREPLDGVRDSISIERHHPKKLDAAGQIGRSRIVLIVRHAMITTSNVPAANVAAAGDGVSTTLKPLLVLFAT